ncbi:Protein CBG08010 [Caenorhabditis briggsae]|uniref:Protein CBG08010 n=2 Tax=Caenorhabditis briggsae TaxID=6238 RepID=A8X5K6_CAEBR|nr:Protein CBG08010 [Caenorhabditis briggsae]CAP27917.2 Protein CBG08010 [Caenorhabditis briggsae]
MRYLIELGSPNSIYYTVFCCSHIIIAFAIFMILDMTLQLFSLFFELFVIFDSPPAIIFFACRVVLILCVTIARFIISIQEFSSSEEPTLQELSNLFQIIPVILYTIGAFLSIKLFSFFTGRYRGYYDVDEDLRLEIKRAFTEFEATIDEAPVKED